MQANCPDCGVDIGRLHKVSCDMAECQLDGDQALGCKLDHEHEGWYPDVWDGFGRGVLEAVGLGLYCYWGPDYGKKGWIECDASHPGAYPDLNRYYMITRWNPNTKKRELI